MTRLALPIERSIVPGFTVRTAAVDGSGFPTMTAVQRVQPDGAVTTVASAVGRVDIHGLAAGLGAVWLSDNTNGVLYRLPT